MPQPAKTLLVIACGAIAREIHQLKTLNNWEHMALQAIDASLHFTPEKIAPAVRAKLEEAQHQFERIYVAFADCGTYGALDSVLGDFSGVERLPGLHCYASFAGQAEYERLHDEDPGTFYLTDFLVQHFERFVVKALRFDEHPELKEMFFGNYNRVVYLAQTRNAKLEQRARDIAEYLNLRYEESYTGYGELVPELNAFVGV
ncbi:MAG: DUF1638 domain-containing protein [Pseudomonadota bacterium]